MSVCVCVSAVGAIRLCANNMLWVVIRLISMCALFDLYRFDGLLSGGLYRYASDFSISRLVEMGAQKNIK